MISLIDIRTYLFLFLLKTCCTEMNGAVFLLASFRFTRGATLKFARLKEDQSLDLVRLPPPHLGCWLEKLDLPPVYDTENNTSSPANCTIPRPYNNFYKNPVSSLNSDPYFNVGTPEKPFRSSNKVGSMCSR